MAVAAVSAEAFRNKIPPETYPCNPFFSLPFVIAMTVVTIMTSTDHREIITPFEKLKRYLPQILNNRFSRCHPLHFLHFCTMARSTPVPVFTLGIFGIFALSESAKMQGVQWANY